MIHFPCACGHPFDVVDDEAGGLIQCPACGRLNDIPTHDELTHLADDGTIKLSGSDEPPPRAVADMESAGLLGHIYQKGRTDAHGEEIDLRTNAQDLEEIGIVDTPEMVRQRNLPKYDPETGELVRPLEMKPDATLDAPPTAVPLARTLPPGYVRRKPPKVEEGPPPLPFPLELFQPLNLLVMGFVIFEHFVLGVSLFTVLSGIMFLILAPFVFIALLIGHYGTVIDEIGPQRQDELPRPLRTLSWHDDLWGPFAQVSAALILCFAPAALGLLWVPAPLTWPVVALLAAVGAMLFPAVLLTTTTSGTVLNLRPDRVLGVIAETGPTYAVLIAEAVVVLLIYPAALLGSFFAALKFMGFGVDYNIGMLDRGWVSVPLLIVAIYLAHLFCWHLGLVYRAHQPRFPWVLQYHVSTKKDEPAPQFDDPSRPRSLEERIALARQRRTTRMDGSRSIPR